MKAIVTGITGQDGAYLTEHLLAQGYEVVGTYRRTSSVNLWRLRELGVETHANLSLVELDITDPSACIRLLASSKADELYNLAAQSFVTVSFDQPLATSAITGLGALHLLEAVRIVDRGVRFYQASTSEMFGLAKAAPQGEDTPFHPRSPYAVAKLFAHAATVNYRESYGIFAVSGILFNHESPLRGLEFVTRKITNAVARIERGLLDTLELGNLNARRDWGFAGEYVQGMHRMLQTAEPDTYVLATGRSETVRQFVELAFKAVGRELVWHGRAEEETGCCARTGKTLVRVNPKFYRPAEVEALVGDPAKARAKLGWSAQVPLEELCRTMVASDLERVDRGFMF